MNQPIAIRADASPRIGTGHVRRCLALAAGLQSTGAPVVLVTRDLGIDTAAIARASGLETIVLPIPRAPFSPDEADPAHAGWAEVSWVQDAQETAAALQGGGAAALIVDHYAFDARWHQHVRATLGCRLVAIDDLGDRPLAVDFVVDHNPDPDHRTKYRPSLEGDKTRLLGGPRFALLSPAYRNAVRHVPRPVVRSIGIFMGGVDAPEHSILALHACREVAVFDGPVEIVTTSANPNLRALKAAIGNDPSASLSIDLPDLAGFFSRHDLHIGAGGGATWERCCIGVPAIVLKSAANQTVVIAALREMDAAVTIDAPDSASVGSAVSRLVGSAAQRRRIAANAARLVDGRGADRVAMAMLADRMAVREARHDDAAAMLEWRNDPDVRRQSRTQQPISPDEHRGWVDRVLRDPDRHLLIGEVGTAMIGVVRYDRLGEDEHEVSIYLDPAYLGLGLGPRLLAAGEIWLRERLGGSATIVAEFHPDNAPSRAMFERAGFAGQGNRVRKRLAETNGDAGQ